jgi:hypothetical protein
LFPQGRNVEIPGDLHVKLRKLSKQTGVKIKALVEEALTAYLKAKRAA